MNPPIKPGRSEELMAMAVEAERRRKVAVTDGALNTALPFMAQVVSAFDAWAEQHQLAGVRRDQAAAGWYGGLAGACMAQLEVELQSAGAKKHASEVVGRVKAQVQAALRAEIERSKGRPVLLGPDGRPL